MFTIVKMSGMSYQDYNMLRLVGSICWIASPGVTGILGKEHVVAVNLPGV